MNAVLTHLPRAQDAYTATVAAWSGTDTTAILLLANDLIKQAIERGQFTVHVINIVDIKLAEKAAVELQEIGYSTGVTQGGNMQVGDSLKPTYVVTINWRWMPSNSRDSFTV